MTADQAPDAAGAQMAPGPQTESQASVEQAASESDAYWREICAAMPPMTDADIRAVAVILRQIDEDRRSGAHPDTD
jgi:hypothetical protein